MNVQNDNFYINGQLPLDAKRLNPSGLPWSSITEVNSTILIGNRSPYLEVIIGDKTYWYEGITLENETLVEKKSGTDYVDSPTIEFTETTANVKKDAISVTELKNETGQIFVGKNVVDEGPLVLMTLAEVKALLGLALKADLVGGKIVADQLPAFVDDILDGTFIDDTAFNDELGVPYIPESNKLYVDTTYNKTYRWSGTIYTATNGALALGYTDSTAFPGDKGQVAFTHAEILTGNPHNVTAAELGLGSVLSDLANKVDKIDGDRLITADEITKLLGIEAEAQKNVQPDMLQNNPAASDYIKNRQVSIPYRAKIMWSGSNDFTIPSGVVVLSAHKNGSPSDINWSQTGNVVTHLGPAMVSTDYMMIMGAYSPATYFSGGGIVQTFNQVLLQDRVATTSPIIPEAIAGNEATNLTQVEKLLLALRKPTTSAKTAVNGEIYNNIGDNTYTDPDPTGVLGNGYWVYNFSGTATIGTTQYGNGTLIIRTYDGTVWKSDVFVSAKNQVEFSGNTTVATTWFEKEVTCIGNGLLTIPATLPDEFNFCLRAEAVVTWAITSPHTWRVNGLTVGSSPPSMVVGDFCQVSKRKGTNEIRITGI